MTTRALPERILPGDPPLTLHLRRSGRARRLSLRISGLDGRVTLTLPPGVGEGEGLRFAAQRGDWIREHLARHQAPAPVSLGTVLPVDGRDRIVSPGTGAWLLKDAVTVRAGRPVGPQIRGVLQALARDRLVAASDRHAGVIGRRYGRITLRDTRSRWGSCTARGDLMYSWRLILAPPAVLDYVAAHEVAHLVHLDHSPRYWTALGRLLPGYETPRRWLRDHGARLHAWRFDG